jgi:hypothetical protein
MKEFTLNIIIILIAFTGVVIKLSSWFLWLIPAFLVYGLDYPSVYLWGFALSIPVTILSEWFGDVITRLAKTMSEN